MSDLLLLDPVSIDELDPRGRADCLALFSEHVWSIFRTHGRSFPWRDTDDPYRILLSELMLQQTQTERVLPKYHLFLEMWPDFRSLASARLLDVLAAWSGLGYNRRALALRTIAQKSEAYGWTLPDDPELLLQLPMIGPATCAAILSFAFRRSSIYLETNVRRVLIHQFHLGQHRVEDRVLRIELQELIALQEDYKGWYYALMDYGVLLKRLVVNPNRRSASYARQGRFENSDRQLRGMLLLRFTEQGPQDIEVLCGKLPFERERILKCVADLEAEGFIGPGTRASASDAVRYGIRLDD